jgi:hypothetical protein
MTSSRESRATARDSCLFHCFCILVPWQVERGVLHILRRPGKVSQKKSFPSHPAFTKNREYGIIGCVTNNPLRKANEGLKKTSMDQSALLLQARALS